jgi:hypothetical protein
MLNSTNIEPLFWLFQTLMNALKGTSLVIHMQLASILEDHTNMNVRMDTRAMEQRTAQVIVFL